MKKHFYHQKLPHYQPDHAVYFVTYRLAGSIPMETIRRLRQEYEATQINIPGLFSDPEKIKSAKYELQKRYFSHFDSLLDKKLNEPYWLEHDPVAHIVAASLHFLDEKLIELCCFCIMPNHVHVLFSLKDDEQDMFRIMQQHKSFTAKEANRALKLTGQFWEHESYDHVVRAGEFENIVSYILNNPVKAGFVKEWQDWQWKYLNPVLM